MILDVHFRKAGAQERGGDHGADEGGAVAAHHHSHGDGQGVDAESLADADHDGQHAVEVAVGVEGQSQGHGQDADDEGQVLTEGRRQDVRHDARQTPHHGGDGVRRQLHDLGADGLAVGTQAGGQNAHEDGGAHEGGAHHQGGARVEIDELLMHLGGQAVVHEQGQGKAQHEGHVAGEHVPDQHGDDGQGEKHVEDKELGSGQFVFLLFLDLLLHLDDAFGLGQFAMETGAAALLLEAGQHGVGEGEHDAEDLDGQQGLPQGSRFDAQHGGGPHGGASPGH